MGRPCLAHANTSAQVSVLCILVYDLLNVKMLNDIFHNLVIAENKNYTVHLRKMLYYVLINTMISLVVIIISKHNGWSDKTCSAYTGRKKYPTLLKEEQRCVTTTGYLTYSED